MADSAMLCSPDADLKSSGLESRDEFGSSMTRTVLLDPRLAEHSATSGSLTKGSMEGEGPMGFKILSSDEVTSSGSMGRAGIVVGL